MHRSNPHLSQASAHHTSASLSTGSLACDRSSRMCTILATLRFNHKPVIQRRMASCARDDAEEAAGRGDLVALVACVVETVFGFPHQGHAKVVVVSRQTC